MQQLAATQTDSELSDSRVKPNWKLAFSLGLGFVFFLWIFSLLLGWAATFLAKDIVERVLTENGMSVGQFFGATLLRRLSYIGSLITLLAVLIPALAFLFRQDQTADDELQTEHDSPPPTVNGQLSTQFVLLILTLGTILVLVPDFVYLRDQFGYRINTVFKFYYQAWMLWSLAAAFGTAYLLQNLRGKTSILFRVVIGIVIFSGLLYPVLGLLTKTNNFKPTYGFTLDDFDRIKRDNPDEAAAIEWLRSMPDGVVAEAVGRIRINHPMLVSRPIQVCKMCWAGRFHESQWRGGFEPQGYPQR